MQTGKKKKPGGGTNTTLLLLSTSRSLLRQMRISCYYTIVKKSHSSKLSTLKDKWKFYQWVVLEETESEEKNESVFFFFLVRIA